jgi:hypothetical protein
MLAETFSCVVRANARYHIPERVEKMSRCQHKNVRQSIYGFDRQTSERHVGQLGLILHHASAQLP